MKTASLLKTMFLGLSLVVFSGKVAATEPVPSGTNAAQAAIRDYFRFPAFIFPITPATVQVEKVEVLFTTNAEGRVNFVLAKTGRKELKQEIEHRFNQITLNELKPDVVHTVVLTFRKA
jgi:hypothetical protein